MLVSHENIILVDDNGNIISNFQPEIVSLGGSIFFSGISTSNLSIANDIDFRMGSGDFTIEWFQNMDTNSGATTRLFQMGTWPSATLGVSIEGNSSSRSFYYWEGGSIKFTSSIAGANIINKWVHFAITRSSNTIRVFMNGSQLGSNVSSSYNHTDSTNVLRIGQESSLSYPSSSYKGYITNFRWVKGSALYTSNFSVPTSPLTAVNNTKLLLLASDELNAYKDSSGLNKIINNSNVSWSNTKPFI